MRILIIGVGYHARRIYVPFFFGGKDLGAQLVCGLDIAGQRDIIEKYLAEKGYSLPMFYTNDLQQDIVSPSLAELLSQIIVEHTIDSVIIATEPLMHYKYARWALENNLNILMDKPITTERELMSDSTKADKLMSDYEELKKLYLDKKARGELSVFSLMSQRRFHQMYLLIRDKIKEVYDRTNCPITAIQVIHSDGQWRMPLEIINQDYHPYNQGYGKCCHSGYHSIDVMSWLLDSTSQRDKRANNADVFASFMRPADFIRQLSLDDYRKLFPDSDQFSKFDDNTFMGVTENFGEIDAFCNVSFKRDGNTLCLAAVDLIHNGFSQRNWATAVGRDLYKGNGRIRQELYFIEQGPFQSITLMSYQSEEINLGDNSNLYGVGGECHLDVHVFRNSKMFPDWNTYDRYNIENVATNGISNYARGHNEDARRAGIMNFIRSVKDGEQNLSDYVSHENSTKILSAIYRSAIARRRGENPVININLS